MPIISSPFCKPEEDPFLLVESCHSALQWLLRRYEGQPLCRTWIDHPYGEEEITRLVDEVMPAMEAFPPLPGKMAPLHPDHFHHQGA